MVPSFRSLPWVFNLASFNDGMWPRGVRQNKPFLHQVALGESFITVTETKTIFNSRFPKPATSLLQAFNHTYGTRYVFPSMEWPQIQPGFSWLCLEYSYSYCTSESYLTLQISTAVYSVKICVKLFVTFLQHLYGPFCHYAH